MKAGPSPGDAKSPGPCSPSGEGRLGRRLVRWGGVPVWVDEGNLVHSYTEGSDGARLGIDGGFNLVLLCVV